MTARSGPYMNVRFHVLNLTSAVSTLKRNRTVRNGPVAVTHLGEVVLRELLLLQHGRALQRVRVDLFASDLFILLSWKRAGNDVNCIITTPHPTAERHTQPCGAQAGQLLLGTPVAGTLPPAWSVTLHFIIP